MDLRGVAGAYIGLETAQTPFGARRHEPKNSANPQIATWAAIGVAGGDALNYLGSQEQEHVCNMEQNLLYEEINVAFYPCLNNKTNPDM
jgi:hypothetical protein